MGHLRRGDEAFPCLEAGDRLGLGGGKVCHDSTEEMEEGLIGRPQLVQASHKVWLQWAGKLVWKPDVPLGTQHLIGSKFNEECGGGDMGERKTFPGLAWRSCR